MCRNFREPDENFADLGKILKSLSREKEKKILWRKTQNFTTFGILRLVTIRKNEENSVILIYDSRSTNPNRHTTPEQRLYNVILTSCARWDWLLKNRIYR